MDFGKIRGLFVNAALDVFKDKEMPAWIKDHPVFEGKKEVKKVFPTFGIKNFREAVLLDPKDFVNKNDDFIQNALNSMQLVLTNSFKELTAYYNKAFRDSDLLLELYDIENSIRLTKLKLKREDQSQPDNLLLNQEYNNTLLKDLFYLRSKANDLQDRLNQKKFEITKIIGDGTLGAISYLVLKFGDICDDSKCIIIELDGRIKFVSTQNITGPNNKVVVTAGEGLFRSYGKIKNLIDRTFKLLGSTQVVPTLDSIPSIKTFNNKNVPIGKQNIVFSSEGEGAWDIATMSMRGIKSCQSWDSEYSAKGCLVGSIASRYVGIIYLTSGQQHGNYGEKMIKRCVVRFGVNIKRKEPVIIVDKMYDSYNSTVGKLFVDALQKRSSIPVLNYAEAFDGKTWPDKLPHEEDIEIPDEKLPLAKYDGNEQDSVGMMPYYDTEFPLEEDKKRDEKDKTSPYAPIRLVLHSISNYKNDILDAVMSKLGMPRFKYSQTYLVNDIIGDIYDAVRKQLYKNNTKDIVFAKKYFLLKLHDANPTTFKNAIEENIERLNGNQENANLLYSSVWKAIRKVTAEMFEDLIRTNS